MPRSKLIVTIEETEKRLEEQEAKKKPSSTKKTASTKKKSSSTTKTKLAASSAPKKVTSKSKSQAKTKETEKVTKAKAKTKTTATARKSKTSTVKTMNKPEKVLESKSLKSFNNIVEYYDLPYRYNQTLVKVLAQNPNTLFVYWDTSDKDIALFEIQYGKNFLSQTFPVLVIHNLTNNYTFEIEINDFANNWYVHVDDTRCKYKVELGRRFKSTETPYNSSKDELVNISFSNTIEMPNDHVLFFKDNDTIYFKNIKTNKVSKQKVNINSINSSREIYSNYDLSEDEDRFDLNNPSSHNPTSNVM